MHLLTANAEIRSCLQIFTVGCVLSVPVSLCITPDSSGCLSHQVSKKKKTCSKFPLLDEVWGGHGGGRRQTTWLRYSRGINSSHSDSGSRQLKQIISCITLRWCFYCLVRVDLLWSMRDLSLASRNTVNFNNTDVISIMLACPWGQQRVYDKLLHIRPWYRLPRF